MLPKEYEGFSKDWVALLREEKFEGKDLFSMMEDIMVAQKIKDPLRELPPPPKIKEINVMTGETKEIDPGREGDGWDYSVNEVYLKWQDSSVTLAHAEADDEEPCDAINVTVDENRRHSHNEYFLLRKYPSGEIKAFWLRTEPVESRILGETLEDGSYLEVPLTPERVSRIARVVLFAHARTMV